MEANVAAVDSNLEEETDLEEITPEEEIDSMVVDLNATRALVLMECSASK